MKSTFEFKKISQTEIDATLSILEDAKAELKETSFQWQNGYPNRASLSSDIENGILFGEYENGVLLAFFAMIEEPDEDYFYIEGEGWQIPAEEKKSLIVHRVAVKKEQYGKGLGKGIFDFAKEYAKKKSLLAIKIDTHEKNIRMKRLLEGQGFSHRGTIYIGREKTNKARLAYEYLLK